MMSLKSLFAVRPQFFTQPRAKRRQGGLRRVLGRTDQLELRLTPHAGHVHVLPDGFIDTTIVTGLSRPTAMEFAPDGRVFVAQQSGTVRVVKDGVLLTRPFLRVTVDSRVERGLVGLTLDPDFQTNHFVYVYYTVPPAVEGGPSHNRLSRFTADGDVSVPGSEQILIDFDDLGETFHHNSGALHFGDDGKLYVAVGDAGVSTRAQSLDNLFGKILRLNRDGSIPEDNPFYNATTGNNRAIWALGLRNPFTFAIQPGTGRIYVNDVGNHLFEEVNHVVAGGNYGWPVTEGPHSDARFSNPVFAYSHNPSNTPFGFAIVGGVFYNPETSAFPQEYVGDYYFADHVTGFIWRYDPETGESGQFLAPTSDSGNMVDLRVDPSGALYYMLRGASSSIHRIEYVATDQAPEIQLQPVSQIVGLTDVASFEASASGAGDLYYQWQLNEIDIPGATSSVYETPPATLAMNGARYRVVVTSDFGSDTSEEAVLTVVGGHVPVPVITLPTLDSTYAAGEQLVFAGIGTDEEDGELPISAMTWQIDFHHDEHTHPFLEPTSGIGGGSIFIPRIGETSTNVWYRVYLTVTDSDDLTATTFVDIFPRTSTIRLETSPSGLQATLDGQPTDTPVVTGSVEGVERLLGVLSPQILDGRLFEFSQWSDDGAAEHIIQTDVNDRVYTAQFQDRGRVIEVTLVPDGNADTLTVIRNGALVEVLAANGDVLASHPYADTARIIVAGADGEADSLRVDYLNGIPVPRFGLFFDGDTSGSGQDQLEVTGRFLRVDSTASASSSGTLSLVAGDTIGLVHFTGVESVIQSGASRESTLRLPDSQGNALLQNVADERIRVMSLTSTFTEFLFTTPTRSLRVSGGLSSDRINAEQLTIGGYRLHLTGGPGADTLIGGSGHDLLQGEAGNDELYGSGGNDFLDGGDGRDYLRGHARHDTLTGGDGDDTLEGGAGTDALEVTSGNSLQLTDSTLTGDGQDSLSGIETARLTVAGSFGMEINATGFSGSATLTGGGGNDTLRGGSSADLLDGAEGDDLLIGGSEGDLITGGDGNDRIQGGDGADSISGGIGNDTIEGNSGNDRIDSGDGHDAVDGGSDRDYIYGGQGRDTIFGRDGNDTLTGGGGADLLVGGAGDDYLKGNSGVDTVATGEDDDFVAETTEIIDESFVLPAGLFDLL